MLIVDAEIHGHGGVRAAVRIRQGRIVTVGDLTPEAGETVLNANGGALLPGLHDHHVHLLSYAASFESLRCGPPDVSSAGALAAALRSRAAQSDGGWIRGIGYHESVAGDIDRHWLDRHVQDVPVRIQHRSGRLWIVNSAALHAMTEAGATDLSRSDGRLYDQDQRLRTLIGASLPPVHVASRQLASYGVTGITDMTPHNGTQAFATLARLRADGTLRQRLRLAGTPSLTSASHQLVTVGECKVHLHETSLPPFDELRDIIRHSHGDGRCVAIHCVTETELVFALAALREATSRAGDRIEHASVTPPALLPQIAELGLTVVTQPNFVAERGDAYLRDVPEPEHGWLYRCRSFLEAGIPLAGGTDTPFGHSDPWRAMRAAVTRRTAQGQTLGDAERLSPEQALALFLGPPEAPARPRAITPGRAADLCLLTLPWSRARQALSSEHLRATIIQGEVVWERPPT
jgi:predicted amidohydrolase YtcJ